MHLLCGVGVIIHPLGVWGCQCQLIGPWLSEWNLKPSASHSQHLQRQMPHWNVNPHAQWEALFTQTAGDNKDKTEPWSIALRKSLSCVTEPGAAVFRAPKLWGEVLNSKRTLHRHSGDCVSHYLEILVSEVCCLDVEPELVPPDPAVMLISPQANKPSSLPSWMKQYLELLLLMSLCCFPCPYSSLLPQGH